MQFYRKDVDRIGNFKGEKAMKKMKTVFAMKFLVWVGVALTLMTLGSVLVPAIYSAGQDFGEFLYSVFG